MDTRYLVGGIALACAVVALRRAGLKEDLDWSPTMGPGRVIDVEGYGVHVTEAGSGPAILLIHGFGGHTYSFRHIVPRLAVDHRVMAVDLKGYGYSERSPGAGLSFTDQVAMLRGLLDRLGIKRTVILGHSMGGVVAQRFAATHPEMVGALVLAATVPANERAGPPPWVSRMPRYVIRPAMPLLAELAATRILRASLFDPGALTSGTRSAYLRPARIRGSMDALLAAIRDRQQDQPFDPARITCPVLILTGEADRIIPRSAALRLQAALPQARLTVIKRAGHLLLEERPDECWAALAEFMTSAEVASLAPL